MVIQKMIIQKTVIQKTDAQKTVAQNLSTRRTGIHNMKAQKIGTQQMIMKRRKAKLTLNMNLYQYVPCNHNSIKGQGRTTAEAVHRTTKILDFPLPKTRNRPIPMVIMLRLVQLESNLSVQPKKRMGLLMLTLKNLR